MYHRFSSLAFLAVFFLGSISGGAAPATEPEQAGQKQKQDQKQKQSKPATNTASMTGCIDEQDGKYIMIDDRTKDPIADLAAEGFETEGFAKHVGHKVTVRGTSNSGETRPLFRVRSIETISESCGPHSLSRGN